MLLVVSPAKSLDFSRIAKLRNHSTPVFLNEAEDLINEIRKYKPEGLSALMNISAKLAELNFERFFKWNTPFTCQNAKAAIYAFKGTVYQSLDVNSLSLKEIDFTNKHLRILSGLYGILAPLDLIQEYRLEMGTKLLNPLGKNLYDFWGNKITLEINKSIEKSLGEKILINLASNEYFKSIQKKHLDYKVVSPVFKDHKNGEYKVISFYAKKARGLMTRFVIRNNITQTKDLKAFNYANYYYNQSLSKDEELVFTR
ncbi:MAG: peroxide stress protein YaaA [Bacteroidetes bacterium 4572_117]|nr:MAG: peroxide stress protein YaaA [Bacteroidetes bacterium 4572_117]